MDHRKPPPNRFSKYFSFNEMLKRVLNRPLTIILVILAVTLFFALHIPRLSFRTSVYDLVIKDIPETSRYEAFKKIFGSDEIIQVVVKSKNVFDPSTFRKIEYLAEAASGIKGVRRVISLPGIKNDIDITRRWSPEKFADLIAPVDLFQKNLISADRRTTVLTLVLKKEARNEIVIKDVEKIIAGAPRDLSVYQIGMPLVSMALAEFTEKDFFRLTPITLLLITIILFFVLRNVRGVLLPITCVMLALVWTFGFMALIHIPLSMLTMIVPVFLIAIGAAYCLYIVSEYLVCAQHADSQTDAVFSTFYNITFPTIMAIFTTAIGIGSLFVNRITAIREFAIFSCFGMFSLMVILLTFFPAALALIPLPGKRKTDLNRTDRFFDRFIDRIISLNLNHQKITLPLIAVLVVFCIVGIFRIRVETNPMEYFKKDIPVSRHFHDIYQDMSGSFPINLVMESKNEDYFEDPLSLIEIANVQKFLETLPGVDKTVSFADYIKLVNYALNQFDPKYYTIPEEAFEVSMLINNYKIMLGEDMLSHFMDADLSKTNILLLTHISSSRDFLRTRERILAHVQQNFSGDLAWDVTGLGVVVSASNQLLTMGQIKSLSLTIILVFGIMFVLFLSIKVGLIAIAANLFPIIVCFGIMGWFGIDLSMATSLIASIAIGLAVDDTIHYLVRYNREFKKDLDKKRALKETLKQMGRPIIFTTLAISVGFSILAYSSFKPTSIFGVMMMITMISALVGDMILLPSLMLHVNLVTLWDLVRLKLGKDPHHGISLFKGMSPTQVHYVFMAGAIKKIDSGEVLFYKGDSSDSMYAVISGAMNEIIPLINEHQERKLSMQKVVNRIRVGDVVGEKGFLRSIRRSSTVIATEPVELLQINWKMIHRLQWLYPPTANKFFLNFLAILCDRLERANYSLLEETLLDDLTGFYHKNGFLAILEMETQRVRRYGGDLSLYLMRVEFDMTNYDSVYNAKRQVFYFIGKILSGQVRNGDTLGRLDSRTFVMLMPQIPIQKARAVSNRLQDLLKKRLFETNEVRLKITLSLVGLVCETDKTGLDLLARATETLNSSMEL
ncbi:MAG TPA: MMPL family transporter [Anaerolineae bacterium]|nr:MMPL family transporter [Anaerolineae bacterium]